MTYGLRISASFCLFLYSGKCVSHAHMLKMASQAVIWMPSSNMWCMKSQRSGQIFYHGRLTTAPRLAVFV